MSIEEEIKTQILCVYNVFTQKIFNYTLKTVFCVLADTTVENNDDNLEGYRKKLYEALSVIGVKTGSAER